VDDGNVGLGQGERRLRLHENHGKGMVAMAAVMTIGVVAAAVLVGRCGQVVIGMPGVMVVMIMGMHARGRGAPIQMPMHASSRRPGRLERQDEHEQ